MASLGDLIPSAGGGMAEPIGDLLEPSNVAAVDIALPTGYLFFALYAWGMRSDTGVSLAARLSSDGGVTFDATDEYAFSFVFGRTSTSTPSVSRTGSYLDYMLFSDDNSAQSPDHVDLDDISTRIEIYNARDAARCTSFNFAGQSAQTDPQYNQLVRMQSGSARKKTAENNDSLRLYLRRTNASPNIIAGKIQLFGVPE